MLCWVCGIRESEDYGAYRAQDGLCACCIEDKTGEVPEETGFRAHAKFWRLMVVVLVVSLWIAACCLCPWGRS